VTRDDGDQREPGVTIDQRSIPVTTLTATPNTIAVRWPARLSSALLTAAKVAGHFVVAMATVLFLGADYAEH
jgi:hypothetical protein